MRGRLHPVAMCVDVGEHFDGADDGIRGGCDAVGFVNDAAEGAADVAVAFGIQPGGVRVAINCPAVDIVVAGDLTDVFPADKGFVDLVLILVAADAAVRLMEFEAREALGWRRASFLLLFGVRFLPRLDFTRGAATSIVAGAAESALVGPTSPASLEARTIEFGRGRRSPGSLPARLKAPIVAVALLRRLGCRLLLRRMTVCQRRVISA